MITKSDFNALTLSPTNKDYYQVWEELLDTAKKLSERWDPTSTNESDPGIVLLKVLTAITDKLNYNIDINVKEAFMPTAAQRESMMKLCDMMGYAIKYYQSAYCDVSLLYIGNEKIKASDNILPRFTNVKNIDQDINFFTTEPIYLSSTGLMKLKCLEGTVVQCETENNGLVSLALLDDNYRYYLPELQIAENGIFIYSAENGAPGEERWTRVDNLNSIAPESHVYKFGFDSKVNTPFIQFPNDISHIINDGLYIWYTRTSGVAGNISARTISQIEIPSDLEITVDDSKETVKLAASDFKLNNASPAYGGKNAESINEAYEGFQKTVGTFDTLVTCRDYMNYIYRQTIADTVTPLVSNILVTDIRNDINRATTICEFGKYGISYISHSKKDQLNTDKITHFDLVFYPFKYAYGSNSEESYKSSFTYTEDNLEDIKNAIDQTKLISHNITTPATATETGQPADIVLIKNYARLNATISTTKKINALEEEEILKNISTNFCENFNMRKLEFGEEIPFESLTDCIINADSRIKNLSLNDPTYITKLVLNSTPQQEIWIAPDASASSAELDLWANSGRAITCDLLVQSILAGRVQLFNYDATFEHNFDECHATIYNNIKSIEGLCTFDVSELPESLDDTEDQTNVNLDDTSILMLSGDDDAAATEILEQETAATDTSIKLTANEIISFRAPNYKTTITYPAYVNYYLRLNESKTGLEANTVYKLQDGEYLFINYTTSTTDDSGESQSYIVNRLYRKGDLIKPNFDIRNSDIQKDDSTYAKTTNLPKSSDYQPAFQPTQDSPLPTGMFAFGPNEQVDILDEVKVILDQKGTYLYCILNDKTQTEMFTGGSDEYILQDGEYLFYTDENKIDMAYYGNGTKIKREGAINIKVELEEQLSLEELLNNGIQAIPWQLLNLGQYKKIIIQEYQYVILGEGDKLLALDPRPAECISATPQIVKHAWFVRYDENASLAEGEKIQELPKLELGDDGVWEVLSSLLIKTSPYTIQILNNNSDSKGQDVIKLYTELNKTGNTIELPGTSGINAIKTSIICQTGANFLNTLDSDEKAIKVKAFNYVASLVTHDLPAEAAPGTPAEQSELAWHNYDRQWTTIPFKDISKVDLSTTIARGDGDITKNSYGLLMIYVQDDAKKEYPLKLQAKHLSAISGTDNWSETDINALTFYNADDDDATPQAELELALGQNIIKIINSASDAESTVDRLTLVSNLPSEASKDGISVILSDYDVVLSENASNKDFNGLNSAALAFDKFNTAQSLPVSGDRANMDIWESGGSTQTTVAEYFLERIKTLGQNKFYYNCLMNNELIIDIPKNKTLLSPELFFDYNNPCNLMTITEVDLNYLETGLAIASSSKLRY